MGGYNSDYTRDRRASAENVPSPPNMGSRGNG